MKARQVGKREGMEAGHTSGFAIHCIHFTGKKGLIGLLMLRTPWRHGPTKIDSLFRTHRRTQCTTVTHIGIEGQSLVLQSERAPRTSTDAGDALRDRTEAMHTTVGIDHRHRIGPYRLRTGLGFSHRIAVSKRTASRTPPLYPAR